MITIQGNLDYAGVIHPSTIDSACVMYAAQENAWKYRLATHEDLLQGHLDALMQSGLLVGSVEFMTEVWRRLGVSPDVPMNSDRPGEIWTMAQVRGAVAKGLSVFAKPLKPKMHDMSGTVFSPRVPNQYAKVPDDAQVLVYPPFDGKILSEWRCYVRDGAVEYAANYSGDFKVQPDWRVVRRALSRLRGFPCAFAADFAVLEGLFTEVVEFNDFWAIGNYGMDNHTYLRMLRERYFEIVRKTNCWDVTKK